MGQVDGICLQNILVNTKILGMEALLHALDSPRRRAILRLVWDRERAAGELHKALGEITFGAVSQHLRILKEAGLVERRRDGRSLIYRARRADLGALEGWLESMWEEPLARLKGLAEAEQGSPKNKRS